MLQSRRSHIIYFCVLLFSLLSLRLYSGLGQCFYCCEMILSNWYGNDIYELLGVVKLKCNYSVHDDDLGCENELGVVIVCWLWGSFKSNTYTLFQLSDNVAWLFFYYFLVWRWFILPPSEKHKSIKANFLQAFLMSVCVKECVGYLRRKFLRGRSIVAPLALWISIISCKVFLKTFHKNFAF